MMEKRENDEMDGSWWKLEAQKMAVLRWFRL